MIQLSEADEAILGNLAVYHFLTIDQCKRLGIGKRRNISERLGLLSKKGKLVDSFASVRFAGPGVHWLTAKGAEEVKALKLMPPGIEPTFQSRAYSGRPEFVRQRLAIVDFHIAVRQWAKAAGYVVDWFRVEFQRNPGGKGPATRLEWQDDQKGPQTYTPDCLAQLTGPDGAKWLLVVEIETGGFRVSLDNYRKHLADRIEVKDQFGTETALQWDGDTAGRLLFVFADEKMTAGAIRNRPRPDDDVWQGVYFKSLPAVIEDFAGGWWQPSGVKALPFPGR